MVGEKIAGAGGQKSRETLHTVILKDKPLLIAISLVFYGQSNGLAAERNSLAILQLKSIKCYEVTSQAYVMLFSARPRLKSRSQMKDVSLSFLLGEACNTSILSTMTVIVREDLPSDQIFIK